MNVYIDSRDDGASAKRTNYLNKKKKHFFTVSEGGQTGVGCPGRSQSGDTQKQADWTKHLLRCLPALAML